MGTSCSTLDENELLCQLPSPMRADHRLNSQEYSSAITEGEAAMMLTLCRNGRVGTNLKCALLQSIRSKFLDPMAPYSLGFGSILTQCISHTNSYLQRVVTVAKLRCLCTFGMLELGTNERPSPEKMTETKIHHADALPALRSRRAPLARGGLRIWCCGWPDDRRYAKPRPKFRHSMVPLPPEGYFLPSFLSRPSLTPCWLDVFVERLIEAFGGRQSGGFSPLLDSTPGPIFIPKLLGCQPRARMGGLRQPGSTFLPSLHLHVECFVQFDPVCICVYTRHARARSEHTSEGRCNILTI
jgi:hypothetical protein